MPHQLDPAAADVIRSSRYSRLTSLSSMMSAAQQDTVTPHHREITGFRRLAKSLWLDLSSRSVKRMDIEVTGGSSSSNSLAISPNNTLGFVTLEDIKIDPVLGNLHFASPMDKHIYRSHFEPKGRIDVYYKELPLSNEGKHTPSTLTRKSKPLTEAKTQNVQANISLKYMDAFPRCSTLFPSKRVLQFSSLPSLIGLKAVVSQVVGGPLQKILILDADKSFQRAHQSNEYGKFLLRNCIVEIWFIKLELALEFFQYCQTGSYVVNGFHFSPEWAPPQQGYNTDHSLLDQDIDNAVKREGASRCLAMKCPPPQRVSKISYAAYKHSYFHGDGDPRNVTYTDIDLVGIKAEFSRFGDIVEVSPMISRRVAVSIHYFDISSAITAMTLFKSSTSELKRKYIGWSLTYDRDITDRPCIDI